MKRSKVKQIQYKRENRSYKYTVIQQYHEERGWNIQEMCRILKISRAAYYKWIRRNLVEDDNEDQ